MCREEQNYRSSIDRIDYSIILKPVSCSVQSLFDCYVQISIYIAFGWIFSRKEWKFFSGDDRSGWFLSLPLARAILDMPKIVTIPRIRKHQLEPMFLTLLKKQCLKKKYPQWNRVITQISEGLNWSCNYPNEDETTGSLLITVNWSTNQCVCLFWSGNKGEERGQGRGGFTGKRKFVARINAGP